MANPTATVPDYCTVLTRSRLLAAGDVTALYQAWRSETNAPDSEVEQFRKYLTTRRYLTDYQAAMIQRGHAEGYFVGGYVILDRIGKGQSAGVYRAVHESGQIVALKVLPGSKAKNPQVLARFQREGRLLTQLSHPNVVRAFQLASAGTADERTAAHYIVMEHLEGETLDEIVSRRKKLPAPEAVRLIHQAFSGLQHLHERRMVHRDLKPANLMVVAPIGTTRPETTLQSTLKILDIGLGRELFDEGSGSTHDLHLTAEGAVVGTPDYLAPEQARDARAADIRADIYSIGCVLYHLLAGRPPFVEKNVMATMVKHATEQPAPIAQFTSTSPAGLQVVLNKMLAKDPAARYATPQDAADALRPFLPINPTAPGVAEVLPNFQKWLDSEMDMPLPPQLQPASRPANNPAPRPSTPAIRISADPVLAPMPSPRSGAPSGLNGNGASRGSVMGPPSGKIKMGTGLAAALASASATQAQIPSSLKPPSMPGRPSPLTSTGSNPLLNPSDFDVELIPFSATKSILPSDIAEQRMANEIPMRPLFDLDRRDFLMLSFGAGGVLAAIGLGIGIAKMNSGKIRGGEEEKKENQP